MDSNGHTTWDIGEIVTLKFSSYSTVYLRYIRVLLYNQAPYDQHINHSTVVTKIAYAHFTWDVTYKQRYFGVTQQEIKRVMKPSFDGITTI